MRLEQKRKKNPKGFSLLEVIVAVFVFSLIMTATAGVFGNSFLSRKKARDIQRNADQAQFAINIMSKTLRTSSVVSDDSDESSESIIAYDYSQGKCVKYRFDESSHSLKVSSFGSGISDCASGSGSETSLVSGFLGDLNFMSEKSCNKVKDSSCSNDPGKVGKVTISMQICAKENCSSGDKVNIQSSVSLRDYGVAQGE